MRATFIIHVRLLNCLQDDVSNTVHRFKTNEIKVMRKKLAIHVHTSVRGEEVVLTMAVILLAAVLFILHDNHKNFNHSMMSVLRMDQTKGSRCVIKPNVLCKVSESELTL